MTTLTLLGIIEVAKTDGGTWWTLFCAQLSKYLEEKVWPGGKEALLLFKRARYFLFRLDSHEDTRKELDRFLTEKFKQARRDLARLVRLRREYCNGGVDKQEYISARTAFSRTLTRLHSLRQEDQALPEEIALYLDVEREARLVRMKVRDGNLLIGWEDISRMASEFRQTHQFNALELIRKYRDGAPSSVRKHFKVIFPLLNEPERPRGRVRDEWLCIRVKKLGKIRGPRK